ncbi:MAG: hypothetical protein WD401_01935, partial [Thermomicrobiaceae bacterium]
SMVLNAMRLADEWSAVHDAGLRIEPSDSLIDSATINVLGEFERTILMSVLNGDTTLDVIALRSGLTAQQFKTGIDRLRKRKLIHFTSLSAFGQDKAEPAR